MPMSSKRRKLKTIQIGLLSAQNFYQFGENLLSLAYVNVLHISSIPFVGVWEKNPFDLLFTPVTSIIIPSSHPN